MKYRVSWSLLAEDQLAELWVSALDRTALADAADWIDRVLRDSVHVAGESREMNRRIVFVPPLAAYFEVDAADRRVTVLRLRRL
jgi:hypothetical protein